MLETDLYVALCMCKLCFWFYAIRLYRLLNAKDSTYSVLAKELTQVDFLPLLFLDQHLPHAPAPAVLPKTYRRMWWIRCGLPDLSLTPLPPVPWPLQLWKDRKAIELQR